MMELNQPQISMEARALQQNLPLMIKRVSAEEEVAHREYLASLAKSGACVWRTLEEEMPKH